MKKQIVIVMALISVTLMSFSFTKSRSLKEDATILLKDKNFINLWNLTMSQYDKIDMVKLIEYSKGKATNIAEKTNSASSKSLLQILGFSSLQELTTYERKIEELHSKIEKSHPEISNTLDKDLVATAVKLGKEQKIFITQNKPILLRNCEAEWAAAMSICFLIQVEYGYEAWAYCVTIADANYMACIIL